MSKVWNEVISICPIYQIGTHEYWVRCPQMEVAKKPAGSTATSLGCKASDGTQNPNCVSEVGQVELVASNGILSAFFPNFEKLPRESASCPLIERGRIEELHSSERLFFAPDTEETHLIRLYLLSVNVPNSPQFYWPVGFEVTGYEAGLQLPVVRYARGEHPEYSVNFSSIAFDILVERNGA
ncbi:MAG: hypothetical protein ABI557_05390 [Aureliella sp.]